MTGAALRAAESALIDLREGRAAALAEVSDRWSERITEAETVVLAVRGAIRDRVLARPDLTVDALSALFDVPPSFVRDVRERDGLRHARGRSRGGWRAVYRGGLGGEGWEAAGPGGARLVPSAAHAALVSAAPTPSAAVAELGRATDLGVVLEGASDGRIVASGPAGAIVRLARALGLRPPRRTIPTGGAS